MSVVGLVTGRKVDARCSKLRPRKGRIGESPQQVMDVRRSGTYSEQNGQDMHMARLRRTAGHDARYGDRSVMKVVDAAQVQDSVDGVQSWRLMSTPNRDRLLLRSSRLLLRSVA